MCDPSLTRAILSALSPVHTSDNVAVFGDIVVGVDGALDASTHEIALYKCPVINFFNFN